MLIGEQARQRRGWKLAINLAAGCAALAAPALTPAAKPVYEEAPINYSAAAPRDPVAQLVESIARGEKQLSPSAQHGYLDALLSAMQIPTASQTLVFSKTSFQAGRISPTRPRALYFNDETYIGYVPGGDVIEIASVDPELGTIFYTIKQPAGDNVKLAVQRETDKCLQCHGESMTRDVPGLVVRSVYADESGMPLLQAGTFRTTHESPLAERWGGWYVSGDSGGQPHMGNARWTISDGQDPAALAPAAHHPKDLSAAIDTSLYLTPHSDIVALMVLEHQVEAHNRATGAAHGTLRALRDEKVMAEALGETLKPGEHSDSTLSRVKGSCEPLVEYLLFAGEAPQSAPIAGSSTFAAEFSARGPRDADNRSLRDLDLRTRLFRYPCSYLVYSRAITGLPQAARDYIYRRLWEVLSGKDTSKPFAHLTPADRTAISQILRDTHPQIRAAWETLQRG